MYLTTTNEDRDNSSFYEEGYDGMNLSKLNLCEEGKDLTAHQLSIYHRAHFLTDQDKPCIFFHVISEFLLSLKVLINLNQSLQYLLFLYPFLCYFIIPHQSFRKCALPHSCSLT